MDRIAYYLQRLILTSKIVDSICRLFVYSSLSLQYKCFQNQLLLHLYRLCDIPEMSSERETDQPESFITS